MRSGAAIRIVARLQMAAAASGSDYTQVLMALAEQWMINARPSSSACRRLNSRRRSSVTAWIGGSVSANTMRSVRGIAFRHVLSLVIVGNRKCFSNSFWSPIKQACHPFCRRRRDFVFAGSSVTGPSAVLVSTASATLEHRDSWAYAFQSYVYPPNPSDFTFLARARPRSHPSRGRRPITFLFGPRYLDGHLRGRKRISGRMDQLLQGLHWRWPPN